MRVSVQSVIGELLTIEDEKWIVPRMTHVDEASPAHVDRATVHRYGLRVLGDRPAAHAGLVAVVGGVSEAGVECVASRERLVADVFDRDPSLGSSANAFIEKPVPPVWAARAEREMFENGTIDSRRYLRTENGLWRVIVSAIDPEAVRAILDEIYGTQLTLLESPWTRAEIDRARADLVERIETWAVTALLDGTNEDGLPVLRAGLREITSEISAWRRRFPCGMIEFFPFMDRGVRIEAFRDETTVYSHLA